MDMFTEGLIHHDPILFVALILMALLGVGVIRAIGRTVFPVDTLFKEDLEGKDGTSPTGGTHPFDIYEGDTIKCKVKCKKCKCKSKGAKQL